MSRDSSALPSSRPTSAIFIAVMLMAAAALGFEVALTRVFSVLLRYQFAFLVISLALCGLGLGGLWAHRRRNLSLSNTALFFGISAAMALLLILRFVFAIRPDQFWIAALLVIVPFAASGAFLAAAFSRYSEYGGRLYGFDLAGAALAALGSVLLMQWVGAIDACLIFGALGAAAGIFTAKKPGFEIVFTVLLLSLVPYNAHFSPWRVPPIPPMLDKDDNSLADRGITQPLFTELGDSRSKSKIVDTRWNAFARTDVVEDPGDPGSFLLYTNGNVPTNMMHWDGNLWSIPAIGSNFPLSDWTFKHANLQGADVLSIGPGGGLDALLALRYGTKRFDGAEINPSIVGLMDEPFYRDYNGGIYRKPQVHIHTAEGRAFVREQAAQGHRYRLIFSALTKTATAGQGTALLESFIYTSDAFNDYVNALDDDGEVAIVGDAPPLLGRLFATAISHFTAQGMKEREAGTHVAVMFYPEPGPYQFALVVKKKPFTMAQTAQMGADAATNKIIPLWLPGQAASNELFPFGALGSGALSLSGYLEAGRTGAFDMNNQMSPVNGVQQKNYFDLSPCPDDRPFVLDLGLSPMGIFAASPSLTWLLGLSVASSLAFAGSLLVGRQRSVRTAYSVVYFMALGIGFMLVEIPLIQKLILPLGYPTLSLTVILFSLLLGGGAGATFSQRFDGEKLRSYALKCAVGVALATVLFGALSGPLGSAMLNMALPVRCILAAVLLLPLGFLLGTPFPSGIRLFGAGNEENISLIWALNGTASVAGSILAAIAAKAFGFSVVLEIGALIYLGVAALLVVSKVKET